MQRERVFRAAARTRPGWSLRNRYESARRELGYAQPCVPWCSRLRPAASLPLPCEPASYACVSWKEPLLPWNLQLWRLRLYPQPAVSATASPGRKDGASSSYSFTQIGGTHQNKQNQSQRNQRDALNLEVRN